MCLALLWLPLILPVAASSSASVRKNSAEHGGILIEKDFASPIHLKVYSDSSRVISNLTHFWESTGVW